MTEERDIVERLKERCVGHPHEKIAWPHYLLHDAIAEITRLRAEITALQDRLEMRHAWVNDERVEVEPGSIPDGISCRDETIKALETNNTRLRAERDRLRGALVEKCGRNAMNCPHAPEIRATLAATEPDTAGLFHDSVHKESGTGRPAQSVKVRATEPEQQKAPPPCSFFPPQLWKKKRT